MNEILSNTIINECIDACDYSADKMDNLTIELACKLSELEGEEKKRQYEVMKAAMKQCENYLKIKDMFKEILEDYTKLHKRFEDTVELMNKCQQIINSKR